ncbi:hypothetical protein BGW80DRAFT_1319117 [Lactifluus volemus]|nr:hypothetical protein BGW80DRAFT_1319117 [Lactifluus volemus]
MSRFPRRHHRTNFLLARKPPRNQDGNTGDSSSSALSDQVTLSPLIDPNIFTIFDNPLYSSSSSVATSSSLTSSFPSSSPSSALSTTSSSLTTSSVPSAIPTTATPTTRLSPASTKSTFTLVQTVSDQPAFGAASSVTPSATTSATPVGGVSSGVIVGGVLAAVLGAAGILAAAVYFLRKCRRNEDEAFTEEVWNRADARRQSTILTDEPSSLRHYNTRPSGSPRPPTMIERHLNNAPTMSSRQPPLPNMYPNNGYGNGYGATQYPQSSFSPGDIVNPTSANPYSSPYAQEILASPVSSNVPDYHSHTYFATPTSPPPALTRQPSNPMVQTEGARQNSVAGGQYSPAPNTNDLNYADLSPAQYTEISNQLGLPVPPVPPPVPEKPYSAPRNDIKISSDADLPPRDENLPVDSPFSGQDIEHSESVADASQEVDVDSPLPSPNFPQFPRIPSLPPTLPEIRMTERSFSPVASIEVPIPQSVHNTPSPFSLEFKDLRTPPPAGLKFKSSPLASSAETQPTATKEPKAEAKAVKRPDTVYDEEDAYGGI